MELQERLGSIEEELNLLKVEIKTVLVDLREELLKREGPMGPDHGSPVIDFVSAAHAQRGPAFETPEASSKPNWPGAQRFQPEAPMYDEPGQSEWYEPQQPASAPPQYASMDDPRPMIDFTSPQPAPAPAPQRQAAGPMVEPPGELTWGVVQIASLGKWAEMAARRIGRTRLEEVLSVHELLTGRHDAAVREALLRMVDLCGAGPGPDEVGMNDVLAVLAQLDALFRSHSLSEVTVLSMLSEVA